MFYSCKLCTYAHFTMVVLQQTWFLEILVVFPNLETKDFVFSLLILKEMWSNFDKNPLRRLKV